MKPSTRTPAVLIVGAGPTGLVLALWLRKLNTPFRIIDKSRLPGETSRALGIQARTLEFYKQLGIANYILQSGITVSRILIRKRGRLVARAELGAMGEGVSPFSYLIFLSQDRHEEILNDELAKLDVFIEREAELIQLTQDDNQVRAVLQTTRGQETVFVDYVCGCDGAHSRVRQEVGIDFPGGVYNQMFFVADVEAVGEIAQSGVQISVSWEGFCIVMPIEKTNSVRLTGIVPPEVATKEPIEFGDVAASVEKNTGLRVKKVNWFSTYHVHHRVAHQFRKDRIFLCGDAAHIHSPAGAQGMNTGIGDAINLAWKLASVVDGHANNSLLSTYEPERIAFARRLVSSTDTAFKLIASQSIIGSLWRSYILPALFSWLVRLKIFVRFFFRTISQTRISYRASALSEGSCGNIGAGDRLPWVQMSNGDNFDSLASLAWQLHVYGDVDSDFQTTASELNIQLHRFVWSEEAKEKGLIQNAFYLIRPDGHIALTHPHQDRGILETYWKKWMPGKPNREFLSMVTKIR